jgi:metal-sulfur cluster biosynthetic enzyme
LSLGPRSTGSRNNFLSLHRYRLPFQETSHTSNSSTMDGADPSKDNANPTILNPLDLPSRRRESTVKTHTNGGTGLFDTLVPAYGYPHDPFALPKSSYSSSSETPYSSDSDSDDALPEEIDTQEIYDLIAPISDPEHPLSLGSLAVVNLPDILISPPSNPRSRISTVTVLITPTITHCSLATVIGLGVRVRLEQALPPRFRVDVRIKEGTHSTADQVNKQLGDKERVAAALENGTLMGVLKRMLSTCE